MVVFLVVPVRLCPVPDIEDIVDRGAGGQGVVARPLLCPKVPLDDEADKLRWFARR